MRTVRVGELTVRLTGGPDGNGGGDGPLVVLCHGFGAPGDDLVPLAPLFGAPAGVRFAFPAAPLAPSMFGGGRAWWMIDMVRLERAISSGAMRDLRSEVPDGLDGAAAALGATIDGLAAGAPVVLGGFSQGAMLACDVALRQERPLAGLVLLSGSFLAADLWSPRMATRAGLPVFQSHGRHDPILPFALAEELSRALADAGLDVELVPFDGGHETPPIVLRGAAGFLARVLAPSGPSAA